MTLTLYNNKSELNKVSKDIEGISTVTGTLREQTDILSPVITVATVSSANILQSNYAYIPEFKRYYFINDIKAMSDKLFAVYLKCDVLMTYADEIKAQTAVIARQANEWNLNLNDGIFKVYQNPLIKTQNFPTGFTGESFILAIAGAGD